jgi:hypothetical protein
LAALDNAVSPAPTGQQALGREIPTEWLLQACATDTQSDALGDIDQLDRPDQRGNMGAADDYCGDLGQMN